MVTKNNSKLYKVYLIFIFYFFLFVQIYCDNLQFPGKEINHIFINSIESKSNITFENQQGIAQFKFNKKTEQFKKIADSFDNLMNYCLYNENFGYYTTGKVNLDSHFFTYPMKMSPNFGAMIAYQAYAMWRSMIISQDIKNYEQFYICEFGAGTGILAKDILETIENYATQEEKKNLPSHWQEFNKIIKYVIFEKSLHLILKQNELNQKFVQTKKIIINKFDASKENDLKCYKIKGLIFSNELIDAFAVHKIIFDKGVIKIALLIPHLNYDWLNNLKKNQIEQLIAENVNIENLIKTLIDENEIYFNENSFNNAFIKDKKWIKLSFENWLKLRLKLLNNIEKKLNNKTDDEKFEKIKQFIQLFDKNIHFVEYFIDNKYFPEIQKYLKRHQKFFTRLQNIISKHNCEQYCYINYFAEGFLKNVSQMLETGFLLTVDYGYNSNIHLIQCFNKNKSLRIFPKDERSYNRHIYDQIGYVDMTTDVNFSDLHLIGIENSFKSIFYGQQNELCSNDIIIAENTKLIGFNVNNKEFTQFPQKIFNNEKSYKLLIQKRLNNPNFYQILAKNELFLL